MKRSSYLVPALFLLALALWLAFVGFGAQGQTKEPTIETCTVDDQNEDRIKTIHCETFDFVLNNWPQVWEDYKSKGETVKVRVDGNRVIPIAPPCKDRIERRRLRLCASGECARMNPSVIIPADCRKEN